MSKLKLVLATGSMEKAILDLFRSAFLEINRSGERSFEARINDERIKSVTFIRPQDSPVYIANGKFDLGISGQDWVKEKGVANQVIEVCTLPLTKSGLNKVKLVLCVDQNSAIKKPADLTQSSIIETEYPEITKAYFKSLGIDVQIKLSHGTTEAKVPDLCTAIVELTETGMSIKQNNLRIIDILMESTACLIANPDSYDKDKKQINEIRDLLLGAILAKDKVDLSFNLPEKMLEEVEAFLPALKKPTIAKLHGQDDWVSVASIVSKEQTAELVSKLKDSGATGIVAKPVNLVVI